MYISNVHYSYIKYYQLKQTTRCIPSSALLSPKTLRTDMNLLEATDLVNVRTYAWIFLQKLRKPRKVPNTKQE